MSRFTATPIPSKTPEELGTGTVSDTSYLLGSEGGVLKKIPTGSASIYTNAIQQFKTVALFVSDEVLDYDSVSVGDVIEAGGFRYQVVASDASTYHLESAGGVRVVVLPVNTGANGGIWMADAFGAVGDESTDDTDALQVLVAAVNDTSGAMVVFSGFYRSTETLAFTCENLALMFQVKGTSGIKFEGCDGITVSQTNKYSAFMAQDMLLTTDSDNLYTGFAYTNSDAETGDHIVKQMYSPVLIGDDRLNQTGSDNGWLTCISITEGDRFYIHQPWTQGAESDRTNEFPDATVGIYATNTTHLVIHDPSVFIHETGILVEGQSEGFEVVGGSIVANRGGIKFDADSAPSNDTNIDRVHIASMDYNIHITGASGVNPTMNNITKCLLFCRTEAYVSSTFKHIIVENQCQIQGNYFFTPTGVTPTNHIGVDVNAPASGTCYGVQVQGNMFHRLNTLVDVAASVVNTVIEGNTTRDDGTTVLATAVVDAGTGTAVGLNVGDRRFGEVRNGSGIYWTESGACGFYVGVNKNEALTVTQGSAAAVNYIDVVNAATGGPPFLRAVGDDANIDLRLLGKGSGVLRFGAHTAIGAETVTGYITIKDSAGTTRKLAVVS